MCICSEGWRTILFGLLAFTLSALQQSNQHSTGAASIGIGAVAAMWLQNTVLIFLNSVCYITLGAAMGALVHSQSVATSAAMVYAQVPLRTAALLCSSALTVRILSPCLFPVLFVCLCIFVLLSGISVVCGLSSHAAWLAGADTAVVVVYYSFSAIMQAVVTSSES